MKKNIQPNQLNLVTYMYSLLFVPISFNVNYNLNMFKDKENLDIVCLDSSKIQYEFLYMNNIEVLDSFSHGYQTMKNIEEKSNNENVNNKENE